MRNNPLSKTIDVLAGDVYEWNYTGNCLWME